MARNTLSGLDRQRLKRILALFFLALLLPTTVLIFQAYKQLKWESFRHHQLQAEELSSRVDAHLLRLMAVEERRAFDEYRFLVIEGGDAANFLQRSSLSAFPVTSDFPGLIGHFQVDADGNLSTPLLPLETGKAAIYDIDARERRERENLQRRIAAVLTDNRLVARPKKDAQEEMETLALTDGEAQAPPVDRRRQAVTGYSGNYRGDDDALLSSGSKILDELASIKPQAAFDRLSEPALQRPAEAKKKVSNFGRVEDLKLEQRFSGEAEALKPRVSEKRGVGDAVSDAVRTPRKEQTRLLQADRSRAASASPVTEGVGADLPVRTFESEIDAFSFSRLDSGEFVIFRNVWRDGQRLIQGALIEEDAFLGGVIRSAFADTALSRMSDLIVAYRGEIIELFNGSATRAYLPDSDEFRGELLYSTRLSAPLSELELIFSVTTLPAGPGATLINWLAAILLLLLCGGFYLLYRLGGRQIDLARQQQDFISAVSHELKTPLTSIRMYGELLREGWATEDKRRGYYDYIHNESERLSRLIDNVLQLARMTRNKLRIERMPVRVDELMDAVRSTVASQVESAGFDLDLRIAESTAGRVVEVDRDSFTQIIINLVDNGLKFSGKSALKRIDICCREQSDGTLLFSVRDYGPGVPKEQMKKIFKLFYRSENELTRETVGTGIGLALVNQLAQGMNGKVDVVNREPGAEFRLTLPGHRPSQLG